MARGTYYNNRNDPEAPALFVAVLITMLSMTRKRLLLSLIAAAILVIGFAVYSKRSHNRLDVTPEAQREIERAKRR